MTCSRFVLIALLASVGVSFRPSAAPAELLYTDVTAAMGISVASLGSGTAWADFDNDGDPDLLVSNSGYPTRVYLFRNDGTVFTNVFSQSGLASEARNFAVGDYDNDGLEDVAFISFGYIETKLFRNIGNMRFQDVSGPAGIHGTYAWRCAWIDIDNDGYLDFYQTGSTAYLFRNRGDGTFEERAAAAGMQIGGDSCVWFDYDNDGWSDCYVGRGSANRLYHNLGDGTFQDVAAAAGVNDTYDTSGVCAGDFDGDGWFDLFSVNIGSPSNKLYRNLGDGTFQDVTAAAGVGDVGDGRTATFLDIDSDGLVDIFSSNHVSPNRLYRNNGDGTFTNIASAIGIANPMDPFGTGFADFDNDGDLDVFLATHFGNKLLRCDGATNHWLQVRLIGTASNLSGIGAVARCVAGGWTEFMRVDGGHGMGDTDSPALEFGLGAWTGPVEISVWWPSGLVETWTSLAPDTQITLREGGSAEVTESAGAAGILRLVAVAPNPATDAFTVRIQAPMVGEAPVRLAVLDPSGRTVRREEITATGGSATWFVPVRGMPPGTYFVRLTAAGRTAGTKVSVVR